MRITGVYVKVCQILSCYVKFAKASKSKVKAVFALFVNLMQTQNLPGCKNDQSRVNVKLRHVEYLVFVTQKYDLTTHLLLQMCSYTLYLLHVQTPSKNSLYRLCTSSDCKANMAFAFRANVIKVVQIQKLPHICYPTVCGTNVYFRYTFTARVNTSQMCPFTSHLPYQQTASKSGHYRLCTYSKHCGKHEICFEANLVKGEQMRSLRHLCHRSATRENPIFRPV